MIYSGGVIIKLTARELAELLSYQDGPVGEVGFRQFMTSICARINEDSGELDVDRDDIEAIAEHARNGHQAALDRIFKRPIDDALRRFTG